VTTVQSPPDFDQPLVPASKSEEYRVAAFAGVVMIVPATTVSAVMAAAVANAAKRPRRRESVDKLIESVLPGLGGSGLLGGRCMSGWPRGRFAAHTGPLGRQDSLAPWRKRACSTRHATVTRKALTRPFQALY
jgi:hypothetical protein